MGMMAALAGACGPAARGGEGGPDGAAGADAPDHGGADGPGDVGVTYVYAHTSSELYRVDPDTLAITRVGAFQFSTGSDQITDIAIDKSGLLIGVSFTAVYRIDPGTAAATRLGAQLGGTFNGLSFVPASVIGETGDDVLIGSRNADGVIFRIDPQTGGATQIGNMGGGFSSSGDLVSVAGLGTFLTADNGTGPDRLVRLAPQTFAATQLGTDIGFAEIWGVAYWRDRLFGFTNGGEFITINPTTGAGTLVQAGGPAWWGAAVTTLAPVIE